MNANEKEKAPRSIAVDQGARSSMLNDEGELITDYTTKPPPCQAEIDTRFTPKKKQTVKLFESYERLGYERKAERLHTCGSWLEFAHGIDLETMTYDSKGTLKVANFCHDRLCPMCAWRRTFKIFAQISKIMDRLGNQYRYIFLTLTVPNCDPDKLEKTLQRLFKAWHRLFNKSRIKRSCRGYFRSLEVTRNPDTGQYHPHFHAIIAVDPDYFTTKKYIKRDEWLQLWRDLYDDQTITQVDVRAARPKDVKETVSASVGFGSAVAEISKYTVKLTDLIQDDPELTDKIVSELATSLNQHRLTALGGVFAKTAKALKLDDMEDGDLLHVDDEIMGSEIWELIFKYGWSAGAYSLASVDIHMKSVVAVADEDGRLQIKTISERIK